MNIEITRTPFIKRVPITNDMLVQDAQAYGNTQSNMEQLVDEIQKMNIDDPRAWIDDAFARVYPSIWSLKYRTLKGKPIRYLSQRNPFANRHFQRAIMDDTHPNKCVEKSRQLGLSETSVTEVVHFLANHSNTKAMYTFPTYTQMQDFSASRVAPIFKDNTNLAQLLSKEVNNVGMKKIGQSYLFMRSSSSGSIGEGVDTDAAFCPLLALV